MIRMTIEEFKEKVKKLDSVKIKEYPNHFEWHINEKNEEVQKYMEDKFKNALVITDAYHVKEEKWIPKNHLDNLIKLLIEADTYEEIIESETISSWVKGEKYCKIENNGFETQLRFFLSTNNGYSNPKVSNYVIDKIRDIEEEVVVEDFKYEDGSWLGWVEIRKESINAKERCKHRCQTDKKIAEFDELFRK